MIARLLIATAMLAVPAVAEAQTAPQDPPKRIRSVLVYGDEACPKPEDPDEIVVCANGGDSPYRIPKRFRDEASTRPEAQSWSRRVEVIEDVNRVGMPGSCSPVGIGGQFGCSREFIRQWAQERLEKEAKAAREK
jgi:hypothetical protein